MTQIVIPKDISFNDWASQIRINLPDVNIPIPSNDEQWRDWASQVIYNSFFNNPPLPTEITYPNTEDWSKWASHFINSIYT